MPDRPRVVAVVLTYRRTDLLRRCVEAVAGQSRPPDAVLVVDNDHLARGVLDDDGLVPEPDCLERLLRETQGSGVLIPRQRRPEFVKGHPPSWNGTLFDAEVVRAVGLPRGDLFFWAEDTEFYTRIRRAGFPIRPVPQAEVFHVNPEDRTRGAARDWRLYYEVRNGLYVRLRLRPRTAKGTWRAWRSAFGKLGAIVLLEPHKRRSLGLWWKGYRDYRRGRLGKVVPPETWSP